ncbi:ABC-type nitrate/sulfonate/bicarbonate transport system ATPase subunit [Rhizobium lentis]|uniref:ABC-type nitrate/sulfonate/bicarbonate transport system ATPase subunit n=1 Tax=Rhizobium lentis TaxID=1138194 RepID=A0A7W8XKI8_9HYPH|nr:ABC-type nitrate/sulfonate/bicarbonate transport system ATPase subunit [Rhizobium lentis]MBB5554049.1 ABC-type nitrate/sulfonate/bicarbonate transport system ATPase subunit [Rhizobium lentis]MBB5564563.1 ABC-type nitrate/sulfonate/bicarbonate transport system ATPase subunit [Rhizobium lentis]MBB5571108.1 ABC-type nitrate/sulfonate/bicarbonate transport system ATPase subunit [Rhizobium lentis]
MVSIDSLTMSFGAYVAVQDVDLSVSDGEFLAIVGPTVCGKSTILNAIAGLLKAASGIVSIDGQPVRGIQNDIDYLFQDALLPWKTAIRTWSSVLCSRVSALPNVASGR